MSSAFDTPPTPAAEGRRSTRLYPATPIAYASELGGGGGGGGGTTGQAADYWTNAAPPPRSFQTRRFLIQRPDKPVKTIEGNYANVDSNGSLTISRFDGTIALILPAGKWDEVEEETMNGL